MPSPGHNYRSRALEPKKHTPKEDSQRLRTRHRGPEDDNADRSGRRHSERHVAYIAQAGPREGAGTKDDGYIQSWLKQTQSHRRHEPSPANEARHVPSRMHTRGNQTNANKRARSLSDPIASPRKESHREPDYRFEKRPRHKIREDKYDYQGDVGAKRRAGQKTLHQDRTARQGPKGRTRYEPHEANVRTRERPSKGLAERAMKSRNAKLERKEQEEDNEMGQFRAFFQHGTSNRKPVADVTDSKHNVEDPVSGEGSEAPWSRASSLSNPPISDGGRVPQYRMGSPEKLERRSIQYPHGRPLQGARVQASPGLHQSDGKSTSYVSWSTSHHSEFFDDRFNGPSHEERVSHLDSISQVQARPRLQSRGFNESNTKRPQAYKDAEVQTDPIVSPARPTPSQTKRPVTHTSRGVSFRRGSGGSDTVSTALARPQPALGQQQAPEHNTRAEQDTATHQEFILAQETPPAYAPPRRSGYFNGVQDAREVVLVRTEKPAERPMYQEVNMPVAVLDRRFGNRLLRDSTHAPQQEYLLQAPEYRRARVEDEEWLQNPMVYATEQAYPSPGALAQVPGQEDRGPVDFDQAQYQAEKPKERPPAWAMSDFIYEIEREAFDPRRSEDDGNFHRRNVVMADDQPERAAVPWSSSHYLQPGYGSAELRNENNGWYGPSQPLEDYGFGI